MSQQKRKIRMHINAMYNQPNIIPPSADPPPEPVDEPPAEGQRPQESIKEYGAPQVPVKQKKNPRGTIQFLNIIGQIEGHMVLPPQNKSTKYEHVIPQLFMAAENPAIDGLLILLNTVGGDVEAGLAIAELISKLGKPTVSLIVGGGHSIGVPLAVSARKSFIAESATMTIHPIRMNGTVVGAPQTYDYFDRMQERVLEFIVRNSRITKKKLSSLMMDTSKLALDLGTVLVGPEAVKEGIIDAVGGLSDAMEALYAMIKAEKAAVIQSQEPFQDPEARPQIQH